MEDFMVKLFEDCNLCAIHAKRVTISARPAFACLLSRAAAAVYARAGHAHTFRWRPYLTRLLR
jgi:hypothetical protein